MPSKARDGPALFEIIGPKRDIRMNPPLTMMKQMGVAGGASPRFHRLAPNGFLATPLRHPLFLPWLWLPSVRADARCPSLRASFPVLSCVLGGRAFPRIS